MGNRDISGLDLSVYKALGMKSNLGISGIDKIMKNASVIQDIGFI